MNTTSKVLSGIIVALLFIIVTMAFNSHPSQSLSPSELPSIPAPNDAPISRIKIDLPEELPYIKYEDANNLRCQYKNGTLYVWYASEDKYACDYQIQCYQNYIEVLDMDRVIAKLNYTSQLGKIITKDNE